MKPIISTERFNEIIDKMYQKVSLTAIFEGDSKEMRSFYTYLETNPGADLEYLRAQQARSELHADDIIYIADNEPDPYRARIMVEARKWYASKMKPNKFGDRIDMNITQTVDINAAIEAAKARTLHLYDTQTKQLDVEDADIVEQTANNATDYKSVSKRYEPIGPPPMDPELTSPEISEDDVFS